MPDVVIVGAGLVGIGIAWRSAQAGLEVTLVDPAPGGGASHAAAGMLAPVTEAHYGEEELLDLNVRSCMSYPSFVAELEDLTGVSTGYRACGTLAVGFDADDLAVLDELHAFQRSLGLDVERLASRDCRRLEPQLAPAIRGGLFVPGDHQVDPRALARALLAATDRAGVTLRCERAAEVLFADDAVRGVRMAGGDTITSAAVVIAAGAWSGQLAGVPDDAIPAIRPVKGQILRLRARPADPPVLSHTLRAIVRGASCYLVPRLEGELVLGATVEEQGFDTAVTAGAVYELLRDARAALPAITELPLVETTAGLRPGSPDNAPLIGPSEVPGLIVATGHYRNGVLLTPITAAAVADLLRTGELPATVMPFSPLRFTPAHRTTRTPEGVTP